MEQWQTGRPIVVVSWKNPARTGAVCRRGYAGYVQQVQRSPLVWPQ
jgi:hypothetical protein